MKKYGLFETMRLYKGRIVYFIQHIERLQKSALKLKIKFGYSQAYLKEIIFQAVKSGKFGDNNVRLTLWGNRRASEISLLAREYKPPPATRYKSGFRALISDIRQNDLAMAKIKSVDRVLYDAARKEALARNFDEAILLNRSGFITEASRSNLFFVKGNKLFTPALACGCLGGITRKVIFDLSRQNGILIKEGKFLPEELFGASEAFLTNSLMGIMPLAAVGNRLIGKNKERKLCNFFMREYTCLRQKK